jgi:hypothetical protein
LLIVTGLKVKGELFIEHFCTAAVVLIVAADSQFVDHLSDQFMCRYDLDLFASQRAF